MAHENTAPLRYAQRVEETGAWATQSSHGTKRLRLAPIVTRTVPPVEDLSIALAGLLRAGINDDRTAYEYHEQKANTLEQQYPHVGQELATASPHLFESLGA